MLLIRGAWVQSLVGELASHMAYDTAKNTIKNKKQIKNQVSHGKFLAERVTKTPLMRLVKPRDTRRG